MRVLVVRHHEVDAAGLVADAFARRGATIDVHLFPDEGSLPRDAGYDHVVVLGSAHSVYHRVPWVEEELDWLRAARSPVLGICFGAQLLCAAHGGAVERSPVYELGWVEVDPVTDLVSRGPWFEFHGDRCVLGPSASLVAENDVGPQAFTVGRHLGVQFHPEVDTAQLTRWIANGGLAEVLAAGSDPDELIEETARQEAGAARRADDLVAAYLIHAGTRRPAGTR